MTWRALALLTGLAVLTSSGGVMARCPGHGPTGPSGMASLAGVGAGSTWWAVRVNRPDDRVERFDSGPQCQAWIARFRGLYRCVERADP